MNGSPNEDGKVSDSGYTNTCVSQSQRSNGSSLSKNSKRSESSGYACGRNTSTVGSSNYALPQPISKRESKEYKEKKLQTTTTTTKTSIGDVETKVKSQIKSSEQNAAGTFNSNGSSSDFTSNCKKSEEVAGIELADDGRLEEHNGNSNSTESEGRIGTITNSLEDTTSNTNAGGFGVVISMKTGLVVDTTPSLKTILGYTRESWMDQSFIEFIHPKDKQTFTNHLAKNMASPYENEGLNGGKEKSSMFCCLRKNDERKSTSESASDDNSSSAKKTNVYLPFHLTMIIEFFRELTDGKKLQMMFLIINAEPIVPVYKAPEEMILSAIFSTRHDPNCIMTHVDANVVQYFGWMPQDMIGRSLFEFYHPEDLPFLKDVYETVVKMKGTPFRSNPYRFAAQNGDYVVLETEWSSFVNPRRGKIEFIAGYHRILQGPTNPNVFQPPIDSQRNLLANISDEVFKESKIIEGEIRALLDEKIRRTEDNDACKITSRCLHTFVKNLLRDDKLPEPVPKKRSTARDRSFSKHDRAIFGAISPHHEYHDSKSSSETAPSYHHLNYNDKITRFFDSKLFITTAYDSDENNINSSSPGNEDGEKMSSNLTGTKEATLSAKNLSSGSINRTSHDSREDTYRTVNTPPMTGNSKIPALTESMLNKHNRDMEKLLVQEYKKRQSTIKNSRKNDRAYKEKAEMDMAKNNYSKDDIKLRGTKRPSNDDAREQQQCKVSKYDDDLRTSVPQPAVLSTPMEIDDAPFSREQPEQNTNMSQPLTVTPAAAAAAVPSRPPHPHFCIAGQNNGLQQTSGCPRFPLFVPIYCVPLPQICNHLVQPDVLPISIRYTQNGQPQQSTYVSHAPGPFTGAIYPPTTCAPVPVPTMYRPFVIPGPVPINRQHLNSTSGTVQQEYASDRMTRPASHATSIKVKLASTMGRSDSSNKLVSLGEHVSTCVSINGECSSLVSNAHRETNATSQFESSLEDSSDSSFYGSFISTSDGNNRNLNSEIIAHPPQAPQGKPKTYQQTSGEKKQLDHLRKGPPWQEGVQMTRELIYKYRITPKPLNEVLEADMRALKTFKQPEMVKDQLAQLYADMGLGKVDHAEGFLRSECDASADSASGSSGDAPQKKMSEVRKSKSTCSI